VAVADFAINSMVIIFKIIINIVNFLFAIFKNNNSIKIKNTNIIPNAVGSGVRLVTPLDIDVLGVKRKLKIFGFVTSCIKPIKINIIFKTIKYL